MHERVIRLVTIVRLITQNFLTTISENFGVLIIRLVVFVLTIRITVRLSVSVMLVPILPSILDAKTLRHVPIFLACQATILVAVLVRVVVPKINYKVTY